MSGSSLPEPRTEVAAATLGGRIVVAGGFLASGANSRRVDAYDPRGDAWERLPDLPVSVDHAAAASWRGRVVVVGGYGPDRAPLRAAFLYDGSRWRTCLGRRRSAAAAAAAATADGRVWVVGGRTRSGLARTALSLDLRTLRWRTVRGPRPREHLAATALGGRVYALGGRLAGYDTNLGVVEAYDPARNRWSRMPRSARPAGRHRGDRRRRPGGLRRRRVARRHEPHRLVARAVRRGRWERLPDLPTPRHGLGVVALGGRVWAIAGGPEPGLTVSGVVESLPIP